MAFKTIRGSFADMAGRSPGVYIAERAASQGALRVMLEVSNAVPGLRSSGEELNSGHL
jgi:hypothetical protein